jgi:hypothetical protein
MWADERTNDVWMDRAIASYELMENLWVRAGEDKAPFLREELIEPEKQLAVERSLVNELFTAGRVQGVWVEWHACEIAHLTASINDGYRSGELKGFAIPAVLGNTPTSKGFDADASDFSITARADLKLMGEWSQASDFTAWSGEPLGIFVGGAVHYEVRETGDSIGVAGTLTGHNYDTLAWTIDASLEWQGLNIFAAVVGTEFYEDQPLAAGFPNPTPIAFLVQAGYQVLPDKLELFVRYEYIDMDVNPVAFLGPGKEDTIGLLTFGANWYLNKHRTKLTTDVVWSMDPLTTFTTGVTNITGMYQELMGLTPDFGGNDGQVALRTQLTLIW